MIPINRGTHEGLFNSIWLSINGCTTHSLWYSKDSYLETILGFYLVDGKNELLAMGEKFSYKFEIKPHIHNAIQLSGEMDYELRLTHFSLNEMNEISGGVALSVHKDTISDSQIMSLEKLGFKSISLDTVLELETLIQGVRYRGEGKPPAIEFENGYDVVVEIPDTYLLKTGKAIATPFTLVFDTLVLTPIVLTVVVVLCGQRFV